MFKRNIIVDVPVSFYRNYVIYQGNKKLKVTKSKRNTLETKLVNNGKITIKYQRSIVDLISYAVSLIMWIGIIIYIIKNSWK